MSTLFRQTFAWAKYFQVVIVLAALGPAVAGAAALRADPGSDALIVLDGNAGTNKRELALDRIWAAVESGQIERASARETTKQVIWKSSAPPPLREAALAKLVADKTPEGQADNRKLLRLRLPTESQWALIGAMCKQIEAQAADAAWREVSGALVRSYARIVPVPPDADRPERGALLALYPGQSIEQIVFGVYMRPQGEGDAPLAGQTTDLIEKQIGRAHV